MKTFQKVVRDVLGQYTTPSSAVALTPPGRTVSVTPSLLPGPVSCPAGQILFNGQCSTLSVAVAPKSAPVCPPGQLLTNGQCMSINVNPNGGAELQRFYGGNGSGQPELQRFYAQPQRTNYYGSVVPEVRPGSTCCGSQPCRLIPWNWWHGNNWKTFQ